MSGEERKPQNESIQPQGAFVSTAYLGIGSNVNVVENVSAGVAALRSSFGEVLLSPVYRSLAVGFSGDDFINLAACIQTDLQPLQLKEFLNALEDDHGRKRDQPKFSDRTLDIDILMYDDLYLHTPSLVLPRAEILHYAHVLRPLAELAPELRHPQSRNRIADLWKDFSGDRSGLTEVDFPL
ncbi:MAG TPA: 2-amino-4-hydroxy-6-hydroxymethyldihydropteridine diphosphokinase [Xanthomonadales bacterium]|nr:2-amino-4-hydroxy-6-hydroxymethyldihydropteridine diphosphokinase [Xanthomonadales bacterium]